MTRKSHYVFYLVLVFVFAFSMVISMHTPAQANECCRLINYCDGYNEYGWGVWAGQGNCVRQTPVGNCSPPAACVPLP